KDKILCWHLYQAVLAGRDICISQKCAEGLQIRDALEEVLTHHDGVDPTTLAEVRRYMKLFWVNNGPYSAITSRKNLLKVEPGALVDAFKASAKSGGKFSEALLGRPGADLGGFMRMLVDPGYKPMCTAKNPEGGQDVIQ